jgi:hypothetical protein
MRSTVGFLMLVLAASATAAQAGPLKVKIGAASNQGEVSFTLSMNSGDSVYVSVPLAAAASPAEKAAAICDAVGNADVLGTWQAVPATAGVAMSFQHLVDDGWVDVDSVIGLADTTGAGTQLETKDQIVDFTLDLDPEAMATGFDLDGGPSFITISVTNTLAFTRAVQMGDTAQSLVDQFEAFLAEQAPEGLSVTRTGPTSVKIRLDGSSSALNWQVTDTGLMLVARGSGVLVPINASLIER